MTSDTANYIENRKEEFERLFKKEANEHLELFLMYVKNDSQNNLIDKIVELTSTIDALKLSIEEAGLNNNS